MEEWSSGRNYKTCNEQHPRESRCTRPTLLLTTPRRAFGPPLMEAQLALPTTRCKSLTRHRTPLDVATAPGRRTLTGSTTRKRQLRGGEERFPRVSVRASGCVVLDAGIGGEGKVLDAAIVWGRGGGGVPYGPRGLYRPPDDTADCETVGRSWGHGGETAKRQRIYCGANRTTSRQ